MKSLTITTVLTSIVLAANVHAAEANQTLLPQSKRTTLGLYITAQDAYQAWKADPANIKVIDVRTPEEYEEIGHPEMAWSVPLTASSREFVGLVSQVANPRDTILVTCRSGNRSAVAVDMLAQAGFKNAYTVVDGFEGDLVKDQDSPYYGQRVVNGWKNAGLPWTKDVNPQLVFGMSGE
jgi:rhodanese-related sulfurtransferase